MKDIYGRTIDYLRISITDKCNYRCVYCMPQEGVELKRHEEILTFEEIKFICEALVPLGLKHLRITGGEPLVRKNASFLIQTLKEINGIETISLTTNGSLIENHIEKLLETSIDSINISLDTLDEQKFHKITRTGNLKDVLSGIYITLEQIKKKQKSTKIKLNCVLQQHNWKEDARNISSLAKNEDLYVRFIERMPLENMNEEGIFQEQVLELLEKIYGSYQKIDIDKHIYGHGPGIYYQFKYLKGKIGFISALSHKFCDSCNRIRITCDGQLRLCLQSSKTYDIRQLIRDGISKNELTDYFSEIIQEKPKEHIFQKNCGAGSIEAKSMSQIGG